MTTSEIGTQVEADAPEVGSRADPQRWRIRRSSIDSHIGVVATIGVLVLLICIPGYTLFGVRLPGLGTSSQMRTVVEILALLALAQMWNLLAGFGGMISIGQQAFIGIGAYSVLVFADDWGVDPFVSLPLAGLVAAALSIPVAFVAFRLRGGYFAIATWVIAEVFFLLVLNNSSLGGGDGRTIRSLGTNYDRFTRENYTYALALLVGFGAIAIVVWVLRSRLGLSLRAIRDSEEGARGVGVNVYRAKLIIWVIAAGWTGLTGALIYLNRINVQPTAAFSVQWSALIIFICVVGGIGSTTGPIIGTLLFWVLRDQLADQEAWYFIILGSVAVLFALFAPRGIYGLLNRIWPFQLYPVRRRLVEAAPRRTGIFARGSGGDGHAEAQRGTRRPSEVSKP